MRQYLTTLTLATFVLLPAPVLGWNSCGHMSVAYVAYQKLTPQVRAKTDSLLAKNPDFHNWVKELPPGTPAFRPPFQGGFGLSFSRNPAMNVESP